MEMQEELLTVLRRSYDNLPRNDVKKYFLYNVLLPKFFVREDLVMMLVEVEFLNGKGVWRKYFTREAT